MELALRSPDIVARALCLVMLTAMAAATMSFLLAGVELVGRLVLLVLSVMAFPPSSTLALSPVLRSRALMTFVESGELFLALSGLLSLDLSSVLLLSFRPLFSLFAVSLSLFLFWSLSSILASPLPRLLIQVSMLVTPLPNLPKMRAMSEPMAVATP